LILKAKHAQNQHHAHHHSYHLNHRLRHNYNRHNSGGSSGSNSSGGGSRKEGMVVDKRYERAEELFLRNPPFRSGSSGGNGGGGGSVIMNDAPLEEEYSSGDEDDLDGSYDVGYMGASPTSTGSATTGGASSNSNPLLQNNKNNNNSLESQRWKEERYFIPTGPDAASMGIGRTPPGVVSGGGGGVGKLAFNYRKLRYFDTISASDRHIARQFLRGELNTAKQLRSKAISNHLRRLQLSEKERMIHSSGSGGALESSGSVPTTATPASTTVCAATNATAATVSTSSSAELLDIQAESTFLSTSLSRFPSELSSNLSAALLLESLAMNPYESIEGMAKCYDGIVSAGTALLDVAKGGGGGGGGTTKGGNSNSSSASIASSSYHTGQGSNNTNNKPKLTKSEIMGALSPLLITTLEQTSGDVILSLSKLRNYCGTRRYQRRFVQRIAPYLVRPPNAAIWCLRHQSDIEPIIAAVEMILENASEVFSAGWYEKGRNMLKDTRRAESLRSAASQLRRTSVLSSSAMISVGPQLHKLLGVGGAGGRRGGDGIISVSNEALAEWEVEALDKAVRQSILDVFSRDWSRISTLNLSPKESDTPFSSRGSQRRGISTAKSKEWSEATSNNAAGGPSTPSSSQAYGGGLMMQSSSLTESPRPPTKLPLSPRNTNTTAPQLPSADALESTFGPSFSSQKVIIDDNERPTSPTNYSQPSPAPLSPKRESDLSKQATPKAPPHSYHEVRSDYDRISLPNFQPELLPPPLHSSPGRGGGMSAPLSPQNSIGYASVSSVGTHRSSSTNQMSHAREQYLALTSTAAERTRTVAACRALRAQISQFEDSFFQMHGRVPKGAVERAPLASTYNQYREWKRAIRADAACRIQAVFRGWSARLILMRGEDKRISNFVMKYATKSSARPFNHLSIPMDMGFDDVVADPSVSRTRLETRTGQRGDDNVEVEMVSANSPSPNWRNRQQRSPQQTGGGISPIASHSNSPLPSLRSRNSQPDVSVMSLAELQQRKRELKQQLKLYDMNFHQQHGRMPEKREKEPIRHLYESYNAYKNQISVIEKGEAQAGPGTAAFRGASNAIPTDIALMHQNVSSPTFNAGNTSPRDVEYTRRSPSANISDASAAEDSTEEVDSPPDMMLEQDLASLKAEKATLHQMLRSYEKDFFKQHKRQVSSFTDIRPVASQYRRYKEIKKAIARKSSS